MYGPSLSKKRGVVIEYVALDLIMERTFRGATAAGSSDDGTLHRFQLKRGAGHRRYGPPTRTHHSTPFWWRGGPTQTKTGTGAGWLLCAPAAAQTWSSWAFPTPPLYGRRLPLSPGGRAGDGGSHLTPEAKRFMERDGPHREDLAPREHGQPRHDGGDLGE